MTVATLNIAQFMGVSEAELIHQALTTYLQEQRRTVLKAKLELLSRYGAQTILELEESIADAKVPEHPAWEDLIVAENLGARLEELDAYLRDL